MVDRVPAYAQFNKLNKKFITVLGTVEDPSMLNHDMFLYKDIEIDLYNESVVGDYDNFSIVTNADQPLEITEDSINELAREKIIKRYPIEKQLSIIGDLLVKLADSAALDATDAKEMTAYIGEIKRTNAIRKQFYIDNPDYVYWSSEKLEAELSALHEGGINEG